MKNSVARISDFGQSIWLDYIRRTLISSGELQKLINEDGLKGVTSNPAIFEAAIVKSNDYKETLGILAKTRRSAKSIFWSMAIEDVQNAADSFAEVYEKTNRLDGYVSLEVSPDLARDTEGTIKEAYSLWNVVDRKNAMIKVPGHQTGIAGYRTTAEANIVNW